MITAVAVLFSTLSTPVLSSLYTFGFFAIGQWSYDLRELARHMPPAVGNGLTGLANIVPNLPVFNMRSLAAAGETTSVEHLTLALASATHQVSQRLVLSSATRRPRPMPCAASTAWARPRQSATPA